MASFNFNNLPTRPRPEPVYDVPLSVAALDLSKADKMAIKQAWGRDFKDLSPEDSPFALIWALERKAGRHKPVDEMNEMSQWEALCYFPPETPEVMDAAAEQMGKASEPVETTPTS